MKQSNSMLNGVLAAKEGVRTTDENLSSLLFSPSSRNE
jgi:hypothetical protein